MARKHVLSLVLVVFLVAAPGWAYDYGWIALMDGLQEVPPVATPATGVTYFTLNADCDTLYYTATWQDLIGTYTDSHIHKAIAGEPGGVVHPLENETPTGAIGSWDPFSAQNRIQLQSESLYVNVHSTFRPGGEIRGQIYCEPDTASFDALTDVGTSQCIQLCPNDDNRSRIRIRNLEYGQYPVVTKRFGCQGGTNPCNTNCCATEYITEYFRPGGNWWWEDGSFCLEVSGNGCACITLDLILPVELSSFDAIAGNSEVTLNWATASERDNERFDIERNGTLVAEIPSQGSVSSGAEYSWTDTDVINGTTYSYALIAVDVNGHREQVATESATPLESIQVTEYALRGNYPNPFNPETKIVFDLAAAGHVKLSVYDLLGREVANVVNRQMEQGRHTVDFRAEGLPSGVYLYRLEANGFTDQQKMLLLK